MSRTREPLWHYTCDHGRAALGDAGTLLPLQVLKPDVRWHNDFDWLPELIWATDLEIPLRLALGLTMGLVACDRTAHRYRIIDPSGFARWTAWARERGVPRTAARELNFAEGAMPAHWYVSTDTVPVVYAP